MPDNDAAPEIDLAALGTFTTDDEQATPPPIPEAVAKEPEADPALIAEDGDEEPEGDPEEAAEELDRMWAERVAKVAADAAREGARDAIKQVRDEDADERPEPERKLAEEVASLKAENERILTDQQQILVQHGTERLQADIQATMDKYLVTDAESDAATKYMLAEMKAKPGLKESGYTWEEALLDRFPRIAQRAQQAPPAAPAADAAPVGALKAPAANGAGAPKPFKHSAERFGDFSDVSAHLVASGLAAQLGKFD